MPRPEGEADDRQEPEDAHPQRVRDLGRRGRATRTCSSAPPLGVAAVGPDQAPLDALLQHVLRFVEENLDGEILEYRNEFIHV